MLFVFPGLERNAADYLNAWRTEASNRNVMVFVFEFPTETYSTAQYIEGGMFQGNTLLDRSEWARIRSGEVYVVTDRDGNSYVKRLRNNLETSGRLILTSDNPNQRKYTPLPLMEDEISNIWTVELVISDIVPPSERDQIDDLRDEMRELREWVRNMQKREK